MKISPRTIMKALRLYRVASDDDSVKSFRNLTVRDEESYVIAELTLDKQRYALLYGSVVDEDDAGELWPEMPESAEPLPNPLDRETTVMPFLGKYLIVYHLRPTKHRLDTWLSQKFNTSITRSQWQKYIKNGSVTVDGVVATAPSYEISDTAEVTVNFPEKIQTEHQTSIVYEDEGVLVIDKPSGMLTHAKGGVIEEATAADIARLHSTHALDTDRPGIVHRLDRDTSGLLVIAKTDQAAAHLKHEFADRKVEKTYLAIVVGTPKLDQAEIDLPIGRNPSRPSAFRVDPAGKSAQTVYRVLATRQNESLVELKPITGRTHQLRVHMQYIGTPILGDRVYGKAGERLALHAYKLQLRLPSGMTKEFTAEPPQGFLKNFQETLGD